MVLCLKLSEDSKTNILENITIRLHLIGWQSVRFVMEKIMEEMDF